MGHNYNDSINFSFKKDLETIKSLPKEKRWKYIWDYYKIIILVLPVALIVLLILVSFPFLLYCSIAAELRLGKVILALYTAYLVEICVLMGQILLSPHK